MAFPNTYPTGDPDERVSARELRMIAVVESFLRQVRSGGSLDPETHLSHAEELRIDLEPLLLTILRLEASAVRVEGLTFGGGHAQFLLREE